LNSIDIFPWNENFNTGVAKIDEQHRKLVQLLNQLASHIAFKSDLPALNIIFAELADYAVYHFQTEEAIWHANLADDPLEASHKKVHDSFINAVIQLKGDDGQKPMALVIEELLSFLTLWLASHILETDRYMAMVVLGIQSGMSADAAKNQAREQMSGTMQVLIDIILSTYGNHVTNTLRLMREIAEHKQAEISLRAAHQAREESMARMQMLKDSALDAIISMDQDGRVIDWNPQAEIIFGYSKTQAIGRDLADLIVPPIHREAHRLGVIRFLSEGSPSIIGRRREISGMRFDGSEFPIELAISSMVQNNQHVFSAYVRDITERKEYEDGLIRSNADLEQFGYAVSHDMRQPLRMISSYLQLLEMGLGDKLDEEKRGFLNFAVDGAKRIDHMLMDLLEFSRIGRIGDAPVWIESRTELNAALQSLQFVIATAQARVKIEGDWPRIFASREEIFKLIQHLISNAAKYSVLGRIPEITISSSVNHHEWRLCVADNGVGIVPAQIKRLFKVFQRLQTRDAYAGTGIGLALCHKIAGHHKGHIWANSAGEGLGSQFHVALPVLHELKGSRGGGA
jgi:PAS domain S-box-containing protein/hemerythrin-like metal-binding protein